MSQQAISKFVRQSQTPHLQTWDVVIVNGTKAEGAKDVRGSVTMWRPVRSVALGSAGEILVSGSSSKLAGSDDLSALLRSEAKVEAEAEFRAADTKGTKTVPESAFYSRLERPALLVYPLIPKVDSKLDSARDKVDRRRALEKAIASLNGLPLVALKIAIPGSPVNVTDSSSDVEYVINTVAQQNWLTEFRQDDREDDLDG